MRIIPYTPNVGHLHLKSSSADTEEEAHTSKIFGIRGGSDGGCGLEFAKGLQR